jgi:hypothetical protein
MKKLLLTCAFGIMLTGFANAQPWIVQLTTKNASIWDISQEPLSTLNAVGFLLPNVLLGKIGSEAH